MHWIVLCAGIAAAGGNCLGIAAYSGVTEIGSSKGIAGAFAVSADSPGYRGCCGCRARRHAYAGAAALRRRSLMKWWGSGLKRLDITNVQCRNLSFLGGFAAADCPQPRKGAM